MNALTLIALVYSTSSDDKRDALAELYAKTVMRTDEFDRLKILLETTQFLGIDGKQLLDESNAALSAALSGADGAQNSIKRLGALANKLDGELERSRAVLDAPGYANGDITAVKLTQIESYTGFFRTLAAVICYYTASQFGLNAIRNLTYNPSAGLYMLSKLVSRQYINELMMCAKETDVCTWRIERTPMNGNNLIRYDGYGIVYTDEPFRKIRQNALSSGYEQISPYIFASKGNRVPYIGAGNFVGVDVTNALSLLDSTSVTSLRESALPLDDPDPDPRSQIEKALGTSCYCISPGEYALALSRRSLARTVADRLRRQRCPFCGLNQDECSGHLHIQR